MEELEQAAWECWANAYAPYSRFRVGAAVRTVKGNIYTGCNIENISFGLTNCAERTAIFHAIAHGEREFVQMAICADTDELTAPCGACRQVMLEFAPQMELILINKKGARLKTTVAELLPCSFHHFTSNNQKEKGENV